MKVFLSYADADKEFVKDLASRLSKEGYEVWIPIGKCCQGITGR